MILPGQHAQSKGCQSKTVSVLLCNYNHGIYLPESLGAICNQTRQPDEVVVIDDGSTDDSWSIIQQFASRYPFVFAIRNGINRGLMFSIARALRIASMDYVVWASADDLLLPGFIERSMEILESSNRAPIVFSQLSVFDDETGETKDFVGDAASGAAFDFGQSPQYLSPSDLERRLTRSYLWLSGNTAVVRRDLLIEGAGFRPELAWYADWFAFYAVALRHGVWLVPETLARMRERKESYSTTALADGKKQRRVLNAFLSHLRSPDGADLRPVFRRHPCLLSPIENIMQATRRSARDWDIYWRILQWTLNHEGGIDFNAGAATGQNRLENRGHNRLRVSDLIIRLTPQTWRHDLHGKPGAAENSPENVEHQFTLVIPTYNRPKNLATLLGYFEKKVAAFRIIVADSGTAESREENRDLIADLGLTVEYQEYDTAIHPFEKFHKAVSSVTTPFCALCADDDLVFVEGIEACVNFLIANPCYALAHGYYFMFLDQPEAFELTGILYDSPSLDADTPLERLNGLFRNYQALTYGIYRKEVLLKAFETVRPFTQILVRELLSSAVAAVEGKVCRLPYVTHGRSQGASESYKHWHPLEWLADDPGGLFTTYRQCRNALVDLVLSKNTENKNKKETSRLVDLIFVFYLVRHAPMQSLDHIVERMISGADIYEIWSDLEIQLPLIEASKLISWENKSPASAQDIKSAKFDEKKWPVTMNMPNRTYRIHERFARPTANTAIAINDEQIQRILQRLEFYNSAK